MSAAAAERRRSPLGRVAVGLVLALALALGAAAPAEATAASASGAPVELSTASFHTELEAAYPAADTVHTHEIGEVRLRFTTAVQPSLSTITVLGPEGVLGVVGEVEPVPGAEGREIRVILPAPLASGAYTVEWRTAGPDSHPIRGAYDFRVRRPAEPAEGDTVPAPAPSPVAVDDAGSSEVPGAGDPLVLGMRVAFFAAVLAMIGLTAFRLAVAGATGGAEGLSGMVAPASRRSRAAAWWVGGVALALVPGRLVLQATRLFGGDAWRPSRLGALLESAWGAGWALHAALSLLFLAGVAWTGAGGKRVRGWWLAAVAALGMPLAVALSGHAAAAAPRTLALLTDAAHVAAAGLWAGTLACVLAVGVPSLREAVGPAEEKGVLRGSNVLVAAFSRLAVLAVGLLVASGVVNAWLQLGAFGDLFTTSWGRTLLLKVGLAIPALGLGFYNWRVVRPRLEVRPRVNAFRVPAGLELALALAVLLATAVLVGLPRPGDPEGPPAITNATSTGPGPEEIP